MNDLVECESSVYRQCAAPARLWFHMYTYTVIACVMSSDDNVMELSRSTFQSSNPNWSIVLYIFIGTLVPRPHPKIGKGAWCYLQTFSYVLSQHIM